MVRLLWLISPLLVLFVILLFEKSRRDAKKSRGDTKGSDAKEGGSWYQKKEALFVGFLFLMSIWLTYSIGRSVGQDEIREKLVRQSKVTEGYQIQNIKMRSGERRKIILSEGLTIHLKILLNHMASSDDPRGGCALISARNNPGYFQDCPGSDQDEPIGYDPRVPIPGNWIEYTTTEKGPVEIWVEMVPLISR